MPETPETIAQAIQRLRQLPGELVAASLRSLDISSRIFTTNADDLRQALEQFASADGILRLWPEDRRAELSDYHLNVVRLFHNYLAAVTSLRDHTRTLVTKHYATHELAVAYRTRAEATFATGLGRFMQDLRNFMLHYGLPATNATIELAQGVTKSAIRLDRGRLHDWRSWKAPSLAYISTLSVDPDLLDLVNSYQQLVDDFNNWLRAQVVAVSARELADAASLRAQIEDSLRYAQRRDA